MAAVTPIPFAIGLLVGIALFVALTYYLVQESRPDRSTGRHPRTPGPICRTPVSPRCAWCSRSGRCGRPLARSAGGAEREGVGHAGVGRNPLRVGGRHRRDHQLVGAGALDQRVEPGAHRRRVADDVRAPSSVRRTDARRREACTRRPPRASGRRRDGPGAAGGTPAGPGSASQSRALVGLARRAR